MQADACAARRYLRYAQTCFAAALELPKLFSKSKSNAKAAAKQVRATRGQRRVAQPKAASALSAVFQNVFCGNPIIHKFRSKALKKKNIITRIGANKNGYWKVSL